GSLPRVAEISSVIRSEKHRHVGVIIVITARHAHRLISGLELPSIDTSAPYSIANTDCKTR
ncbi:MAG: hypothetical protein ACK56I_37340, partial [bacterium]